jgi:hypothetical protein
MEKLLKYRRIKGSGCQQACPYPVEMEPLALKMGQRDSPIHVVFISPSEANPLLQDLLVFIPSQLALMWALLILSGPVCNLLFFVFSSFLFLLFFSSFLFGTQRSLFFVLKQSGPGPNLLFKLKWFSRSPFFLHLII